MHSMLHSLDQVGDHVCPVPKDVKEAPFALAVLVLATCNRSSAQLTSVRTHRDKAVWVYSNLHAMILNNMLQCMQHHMRIS